MDNRHYIVCLETSQAGLPLYIGRKINSQYYINPLGQVWYPLNEEGEAKKSFRRPEMITTNNIYQAIFFSNIDEEFMKMVRIWYPNAVMEEIEIRIL